MNKHSRRGRIGLTWIVGTLACLLMVASFVMALQRFEQAETKEPPIRPIGGTDIGLYFER